MRRGWLLVVAGTYRAEVQRGFPGAVGRVREADQQRAVEADLAATVPIVEHCAQAAMAALMLVSKFPSRAIPRSN